MLSQGLPVLLALTRKTALIRQQETTVRTWLQSHTSAVHDELRLSGGGLRKLTVKLLPSLQRSVLTGEQEGGDVFAVAVAISQARKRGGQLLRKCIGAVKAEHILCACSGEFRTAVAYKVGKQPQL